MTLPVLATGNNTTFEISSGTELARPGDCDRRELRDQQRRDDAVARVERCRRRSLEASGGASLTLPILTAYNSGSGYTSTFSATGTGSVLSLPELATITANTNFETAVQISSSTGGEVEMPVLTQSTGPVTISSSTGTLAVAALTSFIGGTIAYSGGTMSLPVLATGNNTTFAISSAFSLPDLASATGAAFQISNGVTTTLPELSDADGSEPGSERRGIV